MSDRFGVPETLAMYTVYYLKFRGTFVELNACSTGALSDMLGNQAFIEAYAKVLAQFLGHPVTVRGPRGELGVRWNTYNSIVIPLGESRPLPANEAFIEVTANPGE